MNDSFGERIQQKARKQPVGRQVGDMGVDGIRSCLPGRQAYFISLRGSNAVVEAAVHLVWEHEQLNN